MQKLKVCRKLMAFVLTLCMVLPLISNQYLVVRAEEADAEETNPAISDCSGRAIEVENGESYEIQTDSQNFITAKLETNMGESVETGLLVKVTVPANGSAVFDVENSSLSGTNPMLIYSDLEQVPQTSYESSYSFIGSAQDEVHYVWLKKDYVDGATITLYTGSNLGKYADKAVSLTKDSPIQVEQDDPHFIEAVVTLWGTNIGKKRDC